MLYIFHIACQNIFKSRGSKMNNNYLELTSSKAASEIDYALVPHNSYWDTGDEKELNIHRIHAYPAKFPAFITTKALEYARDKRLNVNCLADIFCGCGTSAYEARRNNIDYWGCDINPVATLIAKVKSSTYNHRTLQKYFKLIVDNLDNADTSINLSYTAIARLEYWFEAEQLTVLSKLLNTINCTIPKSSKYHDFFICAFSNILKISSRWLQKSIKPQIDPNKVPANSIDAFKKQVAFMMKAFDENIINQDNARIKITNGNFLTTSTTKISDVSLIVTSPPYVTSYEYADLHQLSSLWLGYADDWRDLRDGSIGSTQHDFNFNKESKSLNETATRVVFNLYDKDPYIAKSVAKYYLDMQKVAQKCDDVLNEDGKAIFVIGNTTYKDVYVNNAGHLSESLLNAGFQSVSIAKRKISNKILTPYRTASGKFTKNETGRKIYSDEFIVIATRQ